jgi:hypothetical protein
LRIGLRCIDRDADLAADGILATVRTGDHREGRWPRHPRAGGLVGGLVLAHALVNGAEFLNLGLFLGREIVGSGAPDPLCRFGKPGACGRAGHTRLTCHGIGAGEPA